MRLGIASSAAVLSLAACAEVQQAGPVGNPVKAQTAANLFNDVCGETAPTFSDFFAKTTRGAYQRDPISGQFNHVDYDLSVQLTEGQMTETCRMRFRSDDDPVTIALFISGTLPQSGPLDLDEQTGFATRALAPNVTMTFQPGSDGSTQHFAQIEVGVR